MKPQPANGCMTLAGSNVAQAGQLVQVTNINTAATTALVVKHELTCYDGSITAATQTLSTSAL